MILVGIGDYFLLIGVIILFLPLIFTELSRPRDAFWGAVILTMGLTLINRYYLFQGAPTFALICSSLIISRLGVEVGQNRWQSLTLQEKKRFNSIERWTTSLEQLFAVFREFLNSSRNLLKPPSFRTKSASEHKKWTRPEASSQKSNVLKPSEASNKELDGDSK